MHPHCDILVTGAAGFLGSHLCDRLLERGHRVIGMDHLCPGAPDHLEQLGRLAPLREHPRFRFMRHGVVEQRTLRVDRIFHLVCPAGGPHERTGPVGTWRLLELARRCGARLLQASGGELDADPPGQLPHDGGQRDAEALCLDYRHRHGVAVRLARIFNTYGPRMRADGGCVPGPFIVQALRGEHITLDGDGRQMRCWCYVDDTVEGLLRLMESDGPGPVDLGSPHAITMRQLAQQVLQCTGSSARVVYRPQAQDGRRWRCPDIALARSLLQWAPRVPLGLGLRHTVQDFARRLAAPVAAARSDRPWTPTLPGPAGLGPGAG